MLTRLLFRLLLCTQLFCGTSYSAELNCIPKIGKTPLRSDYFLRRCAAIATALIQLAIPHAIPELMAEYDDGTRDVNADIAEQATMFAQHACIPRKYPQHSPIVLCLPGTVCTKQFPTQDRSLFVLFNNIHHKAELEANHEKPTNQCYAHYVFYPDGTLGPSLLFPCGDIRTNAGDMTVDLKDFRPHFTMELPQQNAVLSLQVMEHDAQHGSSHFDWWLEHNTPTIKTIQESGSNA